MKRVFLATVLLIVLLSTALSSSCSAGKITVSLGQEFMLPVGETVVIAGESLSISFVEVTGDSRCPSGVECIQAGDAECQMLIKYLESQSAVVLTQQGGSENNQQIFNQYTINFWLEPYPEAGKQIAQSDYKLVMTVTK